MTQIAIVKLTDENRPAMLELALRDCALRWFECGEARAYCGLIRAAGASSRWEENHHREIHGNQSDIHRRE